MRWHAFCSLVHVMNKAKWFGTVLLLTLVLLPASARKRQQIPDSLRTLSFEINGVAFSMQRVEGGSFIMGATRDQYDPDTYTDKPAHLVFLSPFYIASTEVTNKLWKSVMPDKETLSPSGYPYHPVSHVSWYDCQEFVRRLDSITGFPFRLPTEAEWEYAARGGKDSKAFRFAGGNEADSVGWLYACAGNWTHPVAHKRPNELGLYDMTGNVAEWCRDQYGAYQLTTTPDPQGADTGSYRVVRGGSYDECAANSHLSVRRWYRPEATAGYIGFRIALTLPNDPMMQQETESPSLTTNIRLGGRRLHFALVPGEEPFYISEEISASLWKKIIGFEPPQKERSIAIGMPLQERVRFAELCSRAADKPLTVATLSEIDTALSKGVIPYPEKPRHQRSLLETQRTRKTRERLSPWAELIGVKVKLPDDPVLLQFQGDENDKRPLRLILRIRECGARIRETQP